MRIIVLGASGQIGSAICEGLKSNHTVIGTSRKPHSELLKFDPFADDWSDLGKPDVLINCIGQIEETAKSSFQHIHVDLTKLILSNRQKLGNPRIIQISALGASSKNDVEFLRTKGVADDVLLQHPNTAVIRPSIVCTHRTMIVKKMLMLLNLSRFSLGFVPVPDGFLKTRIQPILPEDLGDLVQQACVSGNVKTIDAVGPEVLSFARIIQLMVKNSNRRLRVIQVARPASDLLVKSILSHVLPSIINAQQYQLLFQDNVADVTQCNQLLGRMPAPTIAFFEHEFRQLN